MAPSSINQDRGRIKETLRKDHIRENRRKWDLRHTRNIRGLQQSIELRTDAPSRTDHKVDEVHQVIKDELVPRIQTLTKNAVLSDRREFYYYKKKKTGRRCSCFLTQVSPDGNCAVCYGFGIVGAYDKYGCKTETIDYTFPNLELINVEPTYDLDVRPILFRLSEGHNLGYVIAKVPILRGNVGLSDVFQVIQPTNQDIVKAEIRAASESSFVPLSKDSIEQRLQEEFVFIRLVFQKTYQFVNMPCLSHLFLRYQLKNTPDLIVHGDQPLAEDSINLEDFGIFEAYQSLNFVFDGVHVTNFDNEDMLIRLEDWKRFKITMVKKNNPAGILTSTDVQARYLIPGTDLLTRFPY